jgi:hypothetical protein
MSYNWNHGGNHGNDDFNWDLDVTYDFEAEVETEFEASNEYDSDLNADVNIDVCIDIDGNSAVFYIDVQAVGDDGATEVSLAAITTDDYSSIVISGYSAVG